MAIQKQLTMTDGNQGNYWRADVITDNVLAGKCAVTLNLYKNAAKADQAKNSSNPSAYVMDTKTIRLEDAEYPLSDANLWPDLLRNGWVIIFLFRPIFFSLF